MQDRIYPWSLGPSGGSLRLSLTGKSWQPTSGQTPSAGRPAPVGGRFPRPVPGSSGPDCPGVGRALVPDFASKGPCGACRSWPGPGQAAYNLKGPGGPRPPAGGCAHGPRALSTSLPVGPAPGPRARPQGRGMLPVDTRRVPTRMTRVLLRGIIMLRTGHDGPGPGDCSQLTAAVPLCTMIAAH